MSDALPFVVPCGHPINVDGRWQKCATPAGACAWHPSSPAGWAKVAMFPRRKYFIKATEEGWEVYVDADPSFS